MVESRSVIRNARLNFAFNTFPLRILSESLAQAKNGHVFEPCVNVGPLEAFAKQSYSSYLLSS